MKMGTKPPLPARNADEAAFVDAEPDNGFDWVQYHGEGQRKHRSAIGQGHGDCELPRRQKGLPAAAEPAPPHDTEMEKALLGSIMLDPRVLDDIVPLVGADDFLDDGRGHDPANGILFSHITSMAADGLPVGDIRLLIERLRSAHDLERVGGAGYLAEVFSSVPHAGNAVYYAGVIRKHRIKRDLFDFGHRIAHYATNGRDPTDLIEEFAEGLNRLNDRTATTDRFKIIDDHELLTGDYRMSYWIDGVLAKGQDTTLGGVYKSMKTTAAIDLVVALATGGKFLGYFNVLEPARVLFMSAESGLATIQETRNRICAKAGVNSDIDRLFWSSDLPRPQKPGDLATLKALLKKRSVDVLVLDPAYLMLPSDDVSNLFRQGEVLGEISAVCQSTNSTLVLIHHAKKTTAAEYRPMELADLAMAGFAEFTRQWILLSRREKYEPGSGIHRLYLSVGGSAGHSGLWGCDIGEGTGHGRRHWNAKLLDIREVRKDEAERKDEAKDERTAVKDEALLKRVVAHLVKTPGGESKRGLRDALLEQEGPMNRALRIGLDRGELEACEVTKGNNRTYAGFRIAATAVCLDSLTSQL